jgi:hypothetical protein
MRSLDEVDIAQLAERLRAAGIVHPDLHADLLDHLCCLVEEMEGDLPMELAFDRAFCMLCPEQDLHHLQKERESLIHSNTIIMTQLKFFLGFSASFLLSMGLLFRMMHWPAGTGMLLMGHAALLGLSFTLLAGLLKEPGSRPAMQQTRNAAGAFAALFIAVGGMFKIFHFPTANIQLVAGILLLNLVFLPLLFIQLYRRERTEKVR